MSFFGNIIDRYEDIVFAKRDPVVEPLQQEHFDLSDEDLAWKAHSRAEEALERAKGTYNSKVHRLPQQWRMIYTMVSLDMDVQNGGFHQFFTNAGGQYDPHIQQDVQYLDHPKLSELFGSVWSEYAGMDYSDQWANRGKSWSYFTEPYKEGRWEEESLSYYREVVDRDSIMPILGRFILSHQSAYVHNEKTKTEGGQTRPQKGDRKAIRGRGCLVTVAVIFLLLLLGVVQIYRPRFASSVPTRIGVEAPQLGEKEAYRTSIWKRNDCSSVIDFFKHGKLAMPCMCKEYARFEIYHENGSVYHVDLLSGHSGPEFIQIRIGLCHYLLSRKEFGRIIGEAGVDEAKLFSYEDLLYSEGAAATKHQQSGPRD